MNKICSITTQFLSLIECILCYTCIYAKQMDELMAIFYTRSNSLSNLGIGLPKARLCQIISKSV